MQKLLFLYPADMLQPKAVDEQYRDEESHFKSLGYATALISLEEQEKNIMNLSSFDTTDGATAVYRGWMLSKENYSNLVERMQRNNLRPITTLNQYLLAHYLPNWYPRLREFTPETAVFSLDDDLPQELTKKGSSVKLT